MAGKNKLLLLAGLLFCVSSTVAIPAEDERRYAAGDVKLVLFPLKLPEIVKIEIMSPSYDLGKENSTFFPPEERLDCTGFSLTMRDVEDYFATASKISRRNYMRTITWVPCGAKGKIFFKNGISADWDLMQNGAGMLWFSNRKAEYIYCDKCPAPFAQ